MHLKHTLKFKCLPGPVNPAP